jgi:hypothetical protein
MWNTILIRVKKQRNCCIRLKKIKFPLCLTKQHAIKTYEGVEVKGHAYSTPALDGGKWSASGLGLFTTEERFPGNHWMEGLVGPRAGLDVVEISTSQGSAYSQGFI